MLRVFQAVEDCIQPPEMRNALTSNQPATQGIGNRLGLLENLLEHIMWKAIEFHASACHSMRSASRCTACQPAYR